MSKQKPIIKILISIFVLLSISGLVYYVVKAQTGIPEVINYHGKLKDSAGHPLSGTYNITFRLFTMRKQEET